jgi:hypothetical protein
MQGTGRETALRRVGERGKCEVRTKLEMSELGRADGRGNGVLDYREPVKITR